MVSNDGVGIGAMPLPSARKPASCFKWVTGYISMPSTTDASFAFAAGTKNFFIPWRLASIDIDSIPPPPRSVPSSASSPIKAHLSRSQGTVSCPDAKSIESSDGRSYIEPDFLTSAGARLTVIRHDGRAKPQFLSAALTLSRDSLTAVSGRPTISKTGSPWEMSVSTSTIYASIPKIAVL